MKALVAWPVMSILCIRFSSDRPKPPRSLSLPLRVHSTRASMSIRCRCNRDRSGALIICGMHQCVGVVDTFQRAGHLHRHLSARVALDVLIEALFYDLVMHAEDVTSHVLLDSGAVSISNSRRQAWDCQLAKKTRMSFATRPRRKYWAS